MYYIEDVSYFYGILERYLTELSCYDTLKQGFLDIFWFSNNFWRLVMTPTRRTVAVALGNHGVLIFHVMRDKIPQGVQVIHQCGGTPVLTPSVLAAASSDETLKNVRLGFDSFLECCSVTTVVVSEGQNGYCRVYVNWEVDPTRPGYNSWGEETYRFFLRGLFNEVYKTAKIRREDKKVSVRFSDKHAERPAETKIVFVSEKPAAGTAANDRTLHLPKKN